MFAVKPASAARLIARFMMWRESASKGRPSGFWMSQNILATAFDSGRQGSTWKVPGSGNARMSESWMALNPRMLDPSKPMPPAKAFSSSPGTTANDFMFPSTSANQHRMKWTSLFSIVLSTKSCSGFVPPNSSPNPASSRAGRAAAAAPCGGTRGAFRSIVGAKRAPAMRESPDLKKV